MKYKSDFDLIDSIKNEQTNEAISELINRHSGIYTEMVCKFLSGSKNISDRETALADKDYAIYDAALNFDPERKAKFCTYLANKTKWMCLKILDKSKKRPSIDIDDFSFQEEISVSDFLPDISKKEASENFKKFLEKEKDERFGKLFDIRYNSCNNKVTPWRVVAEELGMSIQGVINLHDRFIEKLKEKQENV